MKIKVHQPIDLTRLNQIYDILVEECWAHPSQRQEFVNYFLHDGFEFRFQGALGFGGKMHSQLDEIWISCYPEDQTDARTAMMQRATTLIQDLLSAPAAT